MKQMKQILELHGDVVDLSGGGCIRLGPTFTSEISNVYLGASTSQVFQLVSNR